MPTANETTEALLENPPISAGVEEQAAPPPFQFSAASALSSTRRDHLENWHRAFLSTAAGSLTDLLRFDLALELTSVQIQSYGQMAGERGADHHAVLFRLHPQPGTGLLDAPLALAQVIVERMTGGASGASGQQARSLTLVEQTVFQRFADNFLANYARNWLPQVELRPEIVRQERRLSPSLHEDDDLVLIVAIRALFKGGDFTLRLITPISSIEELLVKSIAPLAEEKGIDLNRDKASPFGSVPVPVSIRWQGFQISLREVDLLAAGDVLMLDNRKCEHAAIWLGDRVKFEGRLVREATKTTVTLTGTLD